MLCKEIKKMSILLYVVCFCSVAVFYDAQAMDVGSPQDGWGAVANARLNSHSQQFLGRSSSDPCPLSAHAIAQLGKGYEQGPSSPSSMEDPEVEGLPPSHNEGIDPDSRISHSARMLVGSEESLGERSLYDALHYVYPGMDDLVQQGYIQSAVKRHFEQYARLLKEHSQLIRAFKKENRWVVFIREGESAEHKVWKNNTKFTAFLKPFKKYHLTKEWDDYPMVAPNPEPSRAESLLTRWAIGSLFGIGSYVAEKGFKKAHALYVALEHSQEPEKESEPVTPLTINSTIKSETKKAEVADESQLVIENQEQQPMIEEGGIVSYIKYVAAGLFGIGLYEVTQWSDSKNRQLAEKDRQHEEEKELMGRFNGLLEDNPLCNVLVVRFISERDFKKAVDYYEKYRGIEML